MTTSLCLRQASITAVTFIFAAVTPGCSSGNPLFAGTATVTVTNSSCAGDFTAASAGVQTYTVDNETSQAGEIRLVNSAGAIVDEIEAIGPDMSAPLTAALTGGSYSFTCLMGDQPPRNSKPVRVNAPQAANGVELIPVTLNDLTPANYQYIQYSAAQLAALTRAITRLRAAIASGDTAFAERIWVTAQQDWERAGASYDSFGTLGSAVDGLPDGLPRSVNDPGFSGLHRLEYGLWHGQGGAELQTAAATLGQNITAVSENLESDDEAGDASNLPVRAHEILEDALRDHLSGMDDEGAGAAYPMTAADLQATRVILGYLAPLINARDPGLLKTAGTQMDALEQALDAAQVKGEWLAPASTPLAARQQVDGTLGALLETLSVVPDLLEVAPAH